MPPLLTQVARTSDALPLVATQTPTHSFSVTTQVQQDAKRLMRSMTAGYVDIKSRHFMCSEVTDSTYRCSQSLAGFSLYAIWFFSHSSNLPFLLQFHDSSILRQCCYDVMMQKSQQNEYCFGQYGLLLHGEREFVFLDVNGGRLSKTSGISVFGGSGGCNYARVVE